MKLLHTADLHIGRTLCGYSLIEDQKYMLDEIYRIAVKKNVDGIIIAGDIYDRPVPPAEAVGVLDAFITKVVSKGIKLYCIVGNHDSRERLGFGGKLLAACNLYICNDFDGELFKVTEKDEFGDVNIYFMPFIKPGFVNGSHNAEEEVQYMIDSTTIDESQRNVCISHYFVLNGDVAPELCDSESKVYVGTIDSVPVKLFEKFDYTALGHIHGPQKIGSKAVYYAGSPLKYSFSECSHTKGVNLITLGRKGEIQVEQITLDAQRDVVKIRGTIDELLSKEYYEKVNRDDYICAIITDDESVYEPMSRLKSVYNNICQIVFEYKMANKEIDLSIDEDAKTPIELFDDFYEYSTGEHMNDVQMNIMKHIMKENESEDN